MDLCELCQGIFVEPVTLISDGGAFEHHDIVRLQSSAASGCHLCLLLWNDASRMQETVLRLWREVKDAGKQLEEQVVLVVNSPYEGEEAAYCRLMARNTNDHQQIASCRVLFEGMESVNEGAQNGRRYPVGNVTSLSTGSPESLEQSATWIKQCLETHVACRRRTPAMKPTRLLQVEQINGMVRLRLRDAEELVENVLYITLSHCWGGELPLKLSIDDYASFKVMLSVADLPRTFQEAVYVTMFLGLSYIWIDALCIIQDSKEDWAREAAMMDEVYANALVNLAASASSDSSGGLFCFREPRSVTPCIIRLKDGYQVLAYSGRTGNEFLYSPLNRRGWVLQERMLATRQLSFMEDSIHWECKSTRACEQFPVRIPPDDEWTDLNLCKSDLISLEGDDRKRRFTSMWTKIVQSYSICDLTFGSDKLIAIAGIAKRVGDQVGFERDEYFAGMWRQDFLRQLLWYSVDPGARSEKYRAPSWSWASIDSDRVAFEDEDGEDVEVARLIDIRTEHDGNPFGLVKGGYCYIQGPMARLSLTYASPGEQDKDEKLRGEEMASINGGAAFETESWEFRADEGFDLQLKIGRWHREISDYPILQLAQSQHHVSGVILEATDVVGQFRRWVYSARPTRGWPRHFERVFKLHTVKRVCRESTVRVWDTQSQLCEHADLPSDARNIGFRRRSPQLSAAIHPTCTYPKKATTLHLLSIVVGVHLSY